MKNIIKIDDINEIARIPQGNNFGKVYVLSQTLFCNHEGKLSTNLTKTTRVFSNYDIARKCANISYDRSHFFDDFTDVSFYEIPVFIDLNKYFIEPIGADVFINYEEWVSVNRFCEVLKKCNNNFELSFKALFKDFRKTKIDPKKEFMKRSFLQRLRFKLKYYTVGVYPDNDIYLEHAKIKTFNLHDKDEIPDVSDIFKMTPEYSSSWNFNNRRNLKETSAHVNALCH